MLFNSKTRLPKVPSADEFFGVTNLEVKLLYPIVPLIGIPVGDFRGMHEKIAPNPRISPIRPAQRDRRSEYALAPQRRF